MSKRPPITARMKVNCRRKKQKLYMATEADIVAALSQNAVSPPDGGAGEHARPNSPSSPAPTSSSRENP